MPYNEQGRFFAEAESVVYHEQAVGVYASLALLSSVAAVAAIACAMRLWRR